MAAHPSLTLARGQQDRIDERAYIWKAPHTLFPYDDTRYPDWDVRAYSGESFLVSPWN